MKRLVIIIFALVFYACSDDMLTSGDFRQRTLISFTGQIVQENQTRANDYGFVTGDRMGIYIVDYEDGKPGAIHATDNRASNVLYTYDGDTYKWSAPVTLYYRDEQTPIDVYGYYPGQNYIGEPSAWSFSVETDQSTEAANGELGGYEQSDLLWGKVTGQKPTTETINVQYRHILAGVRVHLTKGTGMTDTEWEKLEKILLVENTQTGATVNLGTGTVTLSDDATVSPIRMLPQSDDLYRAIVIPQTLAANKQLISLTLDGQTYSHHLTTSMIYQAGKLHDFTLTVNKSDATGDYQIALAYDGITDWVNDESSHSFSTTAYVVVHCDSIGTLKECITEAGYDYQTIQNLKVTGYLTDSDFDLLRKEMSELKHLNLKDVNIKHVYHSYWTSNSNGSLVEYYMDDVFPANAFYGNKSIRSIVLPSSIKRIEGNAFREMQLMFSTLEIPEGVTVIEGNAFSYNDYNGVELILPNSLDSICAYAFCDCLYGCELQLSDNISYIGEYAFRKCSNFYGVFHVPSKLKSLVGCFDEVGSNGSFTGELEIPQGITELNASLCVSMAKRADVTLPAGIKKIERGWPDKGFASLHFNDDLEEIGNECFAWVKMPPGGIKLPDGLVKLGSRAFCENGLEGEIVIPEGCLTIGDDAFARNQLTSITLPSQLELIGNGVFLGSALLTQITIPKYVDWIGEGAFAECYALQTVVCLNPEPPTLGNNAFGVYFDKCVLEVPEASVEAYRHADGWKQFQNITAYHELAFNVPEITALDKGQTVEGIIRAEGAWTVSECPDWITVSPSSGSGKEELTVTVKSSTENREGKIVFDLTGKGYTTYTTVKQLVSDTYKEDATIVLQSATAGGTPIPLFLVGDGYNAEDIVSGQYIEDMKQQMEYLFSCEPYKSYRNYFTVSTAIAVSPESDINGRTRFNTESYAGSFYSDYDAIWQYALSYGTGITEEREGQTTIVVLLNTNQTCNTTQLSDNGRSITLMGKSTDSYPFDQRGFVLREVGGTAFGKLGPEHIFHFTFLKACVCPGCNQLSRYEWAKQKGWYENVSISGKLNEVPWKDLIFHDTYGKYVDIYEGGCGHARGVYRSENMSVMGDTFIPYFNAISRLSIVKRILTYSGEGYTFDKFVEKDVYEYPTE